MVIQKTVVIALICGKSKPTFLTAYLTDPVSELQELSQGFVINGKHFLLKVTSVTCDAPARAFIKGIKSHTVIQVVTSASSLVCTLIT